VTTTDHDTASRAFHVAALHEAGFTDVELLWHDLTEGLLAALA
jgi:hypothetical protein